MRVISFFKSVKLAVALILILAASSVVGTLFPQNMSPHRGVEAYGQGMYRALEFLGIFDLYHSGWFVFLVLLLALNILICSLSRVRRTYRLTTWKDSVDSGGVPSGLPLRRTLKIKTPADAMWLKLGVGLARLGFRANPVADGDLRLDRGRPGRWGPEISHLGFLVIIAGMVVGSLTGFKGVVDLAEGETEGQVYERSGRAVSLPFEIRCDDFEAVFFDGSMRPKEYTSWLTVIEDGQDLFQRKVEVNSPLKHRGYWFYQSTYGRIGPAPGEEWIRLMVRPENILMDLEIGKKKALVDTVDEIELLRFEPDFVIGENRQATSRSEQLHNPAAQIRLYRDGEPLSEQWVFSEFPGFHPPADETHTFDLVDFGFREFTGLQVARDPGVPVVWTGCGLLILGLILSFTVQHRRIWIHVESRGSETDLSIAAGARGGLRRFEESLDEILETLGRRRDREEGARS